MSRAADGRRRQTGTQNVEQMANLTIEKLTITYTMARTGQALTAVQDASFGVAEGEFVAIIGPSGCGKTSILNAVAGIQPISAGQIAVGGQEVRGPGRDRAMVFQSPALLPWRSMLGNVAYGLELQGVRRPEAHARARAQIDLVGLTGFEESYPHELSGGMQQRANLARALAVAPQVLLFDEPLAALDAQSRELMQMELQRVWMERRVTALFVTHQIDEAILLADRVLVMSAAPGRMVANIAVPLPRPRRQLDRSAPAFVELERDIRRVLADGAAAHLLRSAEG